MKTGIDKSRIISIGTAVPEYEALQDTILEFMQDVYSEPVASRKLNMLFQHSGINTRYSVVPDFSNQGSNILFSKNNGKPFLEERIDVYKQHALPLAIGAIHSAFKRLKLPVNEFGITHLITVTCTGLHAPGLDAELMEHLKLPSDIFHTSLNFLGCNAAFPALKIADSLVKSDPGARVLVVCVELCTLHFQPKGNSDNLLSNTLFGDGAAAVIMTSQEYAQKQSFEGITLNGFYSSLLSKGKNLMGWNLTSINFEMILNSGVPDFLGKELETLKEKIAVRLNIRFSDIQHWAIHPGGKKILDEVKQQLSLTSDDLRHSYQVLKKYGNMSSPTVLFVLAEILKDGIKNGDNILSMGFGPGISIESAVMTYENA